MPRKNSTFLTDSMCRRFSAKSAADRVQRFDSGQPGLCLRITPHGTKTWTVFYRQGERQGKETLGHFPAISCDEARVLAHEVRHQAKAGIDPRVARKADQARERSEAEKASKMAITFGSVADKYIRRECPRLKRGNESKVIIEQRLLPAWKDKAIIELDRDDLDALTTELIDQGKPAAAHRLHETARRVITWGIDKGIIKRTVISVSPFAGMSPPVAKVSRDRYFKNSEIPRFWSATDELGYPFGSMLKVLLLTGQRLQEVAQMQKGEIDGRTWIIPATRSKNGKPHLVPLSPQAVEILEAMPEWKGNYLFTTTAGRRPVSGHSKAKSRLDGIIEAQAKKDGVTPLPSWRIHDLRRTCRTGLASLGVPDAVAEAVLNHAKRGLVATYNLHAYEVEKSEVLDEWGAKVRDLVEPAPANVVPMARA